MILYHGSKNVVGKPVFGYGKVHNDYGQGFYCTEDATLADEWACQDESGGFTNRYELDTAHLRVLHLEEKDMISWIALLVSNRIVRYGSPIEKKGAEYIVRSFAPDITGYDLIEGYRADDSYFTYTRAFLANTISLEQLSLAVKLGDLGRQVCLKSRRSFEAIRFLDAAVADGGICFPRRMERDRRARDGFYRLLEEDTENGIYIRDIMKKEMTADELRL